MSEVTFIHEHRDLIPQHLPQGVEDLILQDAEACDNVLQQMRPIYPGAYSMYYLDFIKEWLGTGKVDVASDIEGSGMVVLAERLPRFHFSDKESNAEVLLRRVKILPKIVEGITDRKPLPMLALLMNSINLHTGYRMIGGLGLNEVVPAAIRGARSVGLNLDHFVKYSTIRQVADWHEITHMLFASVLTNSEGVSTYRLGREFTMLHEILGGPDDRIYWWEPDSSISINLGPLLLGEQNFWPWLYQSYMKLTEIFFENPSVSLFMKWAYEQRDIRGWWELAKGFHDGEMAKEEVLAHIRDTLVNTEKVVVDGETRLIYPASAVV